MHNVIRVFLSDAKRLGTNVVAIVVIMGLTVIPCLYAWFNIFSNWDPYGPSATSKLQVAVASSDKGVDIDTLNLNIGSVIVSNLKQNKTINWKFPKNAEDARDGVRSGKYYAALIIDKDFSENMISFLGGDPTHPEISYYENEKKNAIAPKITSKVKTTVQEEVNRSFVSTLASSLVQVSNYVVSEDNQNNFSGTALLRMKQMDSDLTLLINMLNSYISLIDSASSLSQAASSITAEMNQMMAQGRVMTDNASDAFQNAKESADKGQNMISDSLNEITNQTQSMKQSADSYMDMLENDASGLDTTLMSLETAASTLKSSADSLLTQAGYSDEQRKTLDNDFDTLISDFKTLDSENEKTKADVDKIRSQIDSDFSAIQKELESLKEDYQNTVEPKMTRAMESIKNSLSEAETILDISDAGITEVAGALSSYPDMMTMGRESLVNSRTKIEDLQKKLEQLISDMESLSTNDQYALLMKLIQTNPDLIADFVSNPVTMDTKAVYAVANNGSGTSPFYIVLSIWVGAVILIAIVHTKILHPEEFPNLRNDQAFFGRYIVFFLIGQMQTIITVFGALFFVQIQCHHPVLFYLACAVTSFVFTLLMYSLVYTFGTVGEAVCVVLMVIQVAGSGGTFPIEVLPRLYKDFYRFMPFQYSMNAVRECIGGMHGNDYWIYLLELLPFVLVSLFLGLIIAILYRKMDQIIERAKEKTGVLE